MNILQLKYFQAVARSGQLSRTAERLRISQPSLSQSIHRMEKELGHELFDRAGGGLCLNEYGEAWLEHVSRLLAEYEGGLAELSEIDERHLGEVEISFRSALSHAHIIIPRIAERCPGINVKMNVRSSESPLVLTCGPVRLNTRNCTTVLHETILVALANTHPLAGKPILSADDVESLAFVMHAASNPISATIDHYLKLHDIKVHAGLTVDSPTLMREVVETSDYACFMPSLTWLINKTPNVSLHAIEGIVMDKYLYLESADGALENPNLRACRNVITEYFDELQRDVTMVTTMDRRTPMGE